MRNLKSPFGKNVFIVNHKRRHRFASTAKVGCSTLKYITVVDNNLHRFKKNEKPQMAHDILGYVPDGKNLVATTSDEYAEYTTVAVWRDPVERFISWYSDKVAHPYQPYIFLSALANEQTVERCLDFLEFELSKNDAEWMDEHVRPQHAFFAAEDIDVFVNISDLSAYLESIGIEQQKRSSNKSKKTGIELTEEQQDRLTSLYKLDYELRDHNQEKFWRP